MTLDCGIVIYVLIQFFLNKPKHIFFKSHKHNEKFSLFVKEYDFIRPDNNKVKSLFNNCIRECYNNYFHTFKLRCKYDIEMTNGDFVTGIISHKKLKQIGQEKGFIHKFTFKNLFTSTKYKYML